MVKIRLSRTGRKNLASFRMVAVDSNSKRESKVLEYLGHYAPHTKELKLNAERIKYWLGVGAQATETAMYLMVRAEVLPKKARTVKKFTKKPGKKTTERAAQKAEAAAKPAKPEPTAEVATESEAPAEVATETETPAAEVATEAPAEEQPEAVETPEAVAAEVTANPEPAATAEAEVATESTEDAATKAPAA